MWRGGQRLRGRFDISVLRARRRRGLITDHFLHLSDGCAAAHHLLDHFPGVARRHVRPLRQCAGLIEIAHALVARETAGIDQHAKPRAHAPRASLSHGHNAFDRAVGDDQLRYRRLGADIHARGKCCLQHAALQRLAGRHEFFSGDLRDDRASHDFRDDETRLPGPLVRGHVHHFLKRSRHLQEAGPQFLFPGA